MPSSGATLALASPPELIDVVSRHGGHLAIEAMAARGVDTLFTLSGAHIFPLYDAATTREPPLRIVDVRHEATAVFAAEGLARLTRQPAVAAVTAGPGVTNSISAVTSAWFNGVPLLLIGGRAPDYRWGSGALQELDHPPLLSPVTKHATTVSEVNRLSATVDEALGLAMLPPRGPVFLDVAMDVLFDEPSDQPPAPSHAADARPGRPDPQALVAITAALSAAHRPLVVLGGDVWLDHAEGAAREFVEQARLPTLTNGMGRGILPPGHPLLVSGARRHAVGNADVVVVVGTPLDFRLGYGSFGTAAEPAQVIHVVDSPTKVASHVRLTASACGSLAITFKALTRAVTAPTRDSQWLAQLQELAAESRGRDFELMSSARQPIHPARIFGELNARLEPGAVVIGDGGDFVSFAGRYVEPAQPGRWLDPGPFGCLGSGLGYAIAARIAHPTEQVVLLLGDGAAGFSLMDVDTLVRHKLPVVMIVGNNGAWGLELHPMRLLYGVDTAATLNQHARYDEVVRALGGDGETVTEPQHIGPALDRAFESSVPYLVNVLTDPDVAYPRTTTGL